MSLIKRLSVVLFLVMLLVSPLSAATITFLVLESGIREGNPAIGFSRQWETGLMDGFFDAGHIVSNTPIKRVAVKSAKEFPDEAQPDFDEAIAGGADFFVLAQLEYQSSLGVQGPSAISVRLFRTKPYQFLFEQRYTKIEGGSLDESLFNAKKAAQLIIPHLRDT
jgi:hypothetical protein